MNRVIRRGVFETNSSSVHSLTVCAKEDYDRWVKGEMVLDWHDDKIVEITDETKSNGLRYQTYDEYCREASEHEEFETEYTSKSGDQIVVFGYDGVDI